MEIKNARQVDGEPFRRWFTDEYFDLIVWQSPKDRIIAFQLCYNKGPEEKALTWRERLGFTHKGVDNGEGRNGHYKMTPILIPDGEFESDTILQRFESASSEITSEVRTFITECLREYNSTET